MYCGDETGSFIGEIGSHTCRFGYGGEDNPKLVTSSYVVKDTKTMATSALSDKLAQQELESILRHPDYSSSSSPLTDPAAFLRQGDTVEHWDNLETVWETAMETLKAKYTAKHTKGGMPYVKTDTADGKCVHPILAITPGFTQFDGYGAAYCATVKREEQIRYVEFLMETMEASSIFLAPGPMLTAFSMGRQTALVVDIGAGGTRVTPVVDGLLLSQSQRRNGRGGDWLGHMTWKAILDEKITPIPRYQLRGRGSMSTPRSKSSSSSIFHTWAMQELMYEIRTEPFIKLESTGKQRVPFTASEPLDGTTTTTTTTITTSDQEMTDMDPTNSPPTTPGGGIGGGGTLGIGTDIPSPAHYTFPDGTMIDLVNTTFGKDLTYLPELFFASQLPFGKNSSPVMKESCPLKTVLDVPLQELIHQSLLSVGDVDIRKELTNNILLTGGSSLFPNLDARLSYELSQILPSFTKPKVIAPRFSVERSCASWIGGSILTSLGSFQQLWLSRKEYEEYGPTMSIQRFP